MGPQRSVMYGGMIVVVLCLEAAARVHSTSAACIAEEGSALLAFKASNKADPQGLLSRWTANGDCCSWGGTFCDSTGHITILELSPHPAFDDGTYFLKGTTSPDLAKLTHVQRLDLGSLKQLSGALPAALGTLRSLQYVSMRRSKLLTDSIPSSCGGLTSLTWLDLGENMLSGVIPSTSGNISTKL